MKSRPISEGPFYPMDEEDEKRFRSEWKKTGKKRWKHRHRKVKDI